MQRIEEYIIGLEFIKFKQNYMVVDAVIRNFEVIGEAANKVPIEIKNKYPLVPWKKMYGLRNQISHEYFGIDYEVIWEIATKGISKVKEDLVEIIKTEKGK
ncbi:MAG: DUF86 domain-containing protein [Bacteroidetes bacterium]|nr:DUF86 domain-containing protein [Bacteroidota bacterium]